MRGTESAATADRWERLQEVFWQARSLSGEEREVWMRSACSHDPAMLAELRQMLAADEGEGILDHTITGHSTAITAEDETFPREVGPYVVTEMIGRGGMAVVFRAHDIRLQRDVALKFLRGAHRDREAQARFINEARAASALDHPHHCPVYDVGTTDGGQLYIAMALCVGGSLAERLAGGPVPVDEAIEVAVQVANALDAAHAAGIIHRDIKPANIAFTERGDARVLDFGVAVLGKHEWSAPRFAAGTPMYMAPEQLEGRAVDRRTDTWALGVVLFEMLTGRHPGTIAGGAGDSDRVAQELRRVRPEITPSLAATVARAMETDPQRRFQTASEFSAALGAVRTQTPSNAHRNGRRAAYISIAAVAVLALGVVAYRQLAREPTAAPDPRAVAVLPFRVTGEAELGYLREGMVDILAAKLPGDGGLRAADPRTVYAAWRQAGHTDATNVTRSDAAALAQRIGAAQALLGEVVGTGSQLVVNASLVDLRGRVVSQTSVTGSHADLQAMVDRLTAEVLSLRAGEEPQRLAALTSTSLPALRAYLEGQAAYRRGRYAEALESYGRALDFDSTFALAGLGLALADGWVGTLHAATRGHAAAWRWRDRLTARDRALLVAIVGPSYPREATGREKLAATELALQHAPDRVELWYWLGDAHFHYGAVIGDHDTDALAERALRRAISLDSTFYAPAQHLMMLYARQGRIAEFRELATAHLAREPSGATADFIRWRLAAAAGGPELAPAALDSMGTELLGWIGLTSQDEGIALADGRRATRIRRDRPGSVEERVERILSVHALALNAGDQQAALAYTDSLAGFPDRGLPLRIRVLDALFGDGDRGAVEREAQSLLATSSGSAAMHRLDRCIADLWHVVRPGGSGGTDYNASAAFSRPAPGSNDPLELRVCDAVIRAWFEVKWGSTTAPRRLNYLDSLFREGLRSFDIGDGHVHYAPIALSRLLAHTGDSAAALSAIRRRNYFIGWQPFLAASLREEARLAAAVSDAAGQERALRHYLRLRDNPAPALRPAADSARAELARLANREAGPAATPNKR